MVGKPQGGEFPFQRTMRQRRVRTPALEITHLEQRTLLSVSSILGPMPLATTAVAPEILNVQIQPGSATALAQLTAQLTAEGATLQATTVSGLYVVQVPVTNVAQVSVDLSASSAVRYADPVQMVQDLTVPNDPDYTNGDEWQLNGTWGINAPGAWSVTMGSDEVTVADTDTGITYNDPDLYDNVWINQAEIPSSVLPNLTDVYNDGVITVHGPEQSGQPGCWQDC